MRQTARRKIQNAIIGLLKTIRTTDNFSIDLFDENVSRLQKFYDDIKSFPYACVIVGEENRWYQPGMQAFGDVPYVIRLFTKRTTNDEAHDLLDKCFAEIEDLISKNTRLLYDQDTGARTIDINIMRIADDEGLMEDQGIAMGEIELGVQYILADVSN